MRARRYGVLVGIFLSLVVIAAYVYFAEAQRRAGRALAAEPRETERSQEAQRSKSRSRFDSPVRITDKDVDALGELLEIYLIQKQVGLNEDQLLRVLPRWQRLRTMREEFFSERRHRLETLEVMVAKAAKENAPIDFEKAFREFRQQDEAFWTEYIQEEDKLFAELTPQQRVRYLLFENRQRRLTGRLLRILKELQEHVDERRESPPPMEP